MGPDPAAVRVQGLVKRFGHKVAVAGVDLEVPPGSFFGLVGPNGAGKTTTLRMATALLRPDAGLVEVDGIDVWRDPVAAKARIGVLPEDLRLFERLTGAELLSYSGLLRGLPARWWPPARPLCWPCSTWPRRPTSWSSTTATACARRSRWRRPCCTRLAVLFLDEPFEAIDPVSARHIRGLLDQLIAGGATVVFSSHVMEMVERLCDRVAVMHQGAIVAVGPIDEVRGGGRLEDAFLDLVGAADADPGRLAWLRTTGA